jgi:hypothetical protein
MFLVNNAVVQASRALLQKPPDRSPKCTISSTANSKPPEHIQERSSQCNDDSPTQQAEWQQQQQPPCPYDFTSQLQIKVKQAGLKCPTNSTTPTLTAQRFAPARFVALTARQSYQHSNALWQS